MTFFHLVESTWEAGRAELARIRDIPRGKEAPLRALLAAMETYLAEVGISPSPWTQRLYGYRHDSGWIVFIRAGHPIAARMDGDGGKTVDIDPTETIRHGMTVRADVAELMDWVEEECKEKP